MSGASHDHLQLGGGDGFPFRDELASLFAQRPGDGGMTGLLQQHTWPTSFIDYEAFVGELDDDVPPAAGPLLDEVKRELVVDCTTAGVGLSGGGGGGAAATVGPMTPNSMSVSSTSSEACGAGGAGGDEESAGKCKEEGDGDDGKEGSATTKGDAEGEDKNKKGAAGKGKGKGEKRPRQPRLAFAFMTKSEVDHLEDGYRWRKYGQKAVKNSPFPRYASCSLIFLLRRLNVYKLKI
uniref:WRKY domain-containing protein n=1 Tax=Oryza brachyantha TaxID=4533 RepID=J3M9S5_ORYBR